MPTPTSSPETSGPRGNGYEVMPIPAEAACAPLDDDEFGEGIVEGEDDAEDKLDAAYSKCDDVS